jgi:integrase
VEHSKLAGGYVDPRAGRIIFRSYAEQWRTVQIHRPSTAIKVEGMLRLHVYPRIGGRPIGSIRPSEIQTLVKGLTERMVPHSVEVVFEWVASIFKAAVADQIIPTSPCRGIKLPSVERPKVIPLSVETVDALICEVPDRYRALIVLGAGTGIRISEALGLTSDRVDWMRRQIVIDRQLVRTERGQPVFGPVKDNRNRPRTVPVPDTVMAALVDQVRRYGLGPQMVVFTNGAGNAFHRQEFSELWRPVAARLGIPSGDGFHQLRHFYASLLIRHGESVKVVQERLGHTTSKMTLDTYSHLWPDQEDRTRAAVDEVLGRVVSSVCHVEVVDG